MESTETSIALLKQAYEDQSKHSNDFRDYMKEKMTDFANTLKNVSEKTDGVITDVSEIKTQTKLTNGRVNSLEAGRDAKIARTWKILFIIVSGLVAITAPIVSYIIIHHYKN